MRTRFVVSRFLGLAFLLFLSSMTSLQVIASEAIDDLLENLEEEESSGDESSPDQLPDMVHRISFLNTLKESFPGGPGDFWSVPEGDTDKKQKVLQILKLTGLTDHRFKRLLEQILLESLRFNSSLAISTVLTRYYLDASSFVAKLYVLEDIGDLYDMLCNNQFILVKQDPKIELKQRLFLSTFAKQVEYTYLLLTFDLVKNNMELRSSSLPPERWNEVYRNYKNAQVELMSGDLVILKQLRLESNQSDELRECLDSNLAIFKNIPYVLRKIIRGHSIAPDHKEYVTENPEISAPIRYLVGWSLRFRRGSDSSTSSHDTPNTGTHLDLQFQELLRFANSAEQQMSPEFYEYLRDVRIDSTLIDWNRHEI